MQRPILAVCFVFLTLGARSIPISDSCDVNEVYSSYTPKSGTLAKNSYGGIVEVREILAPTTLETGKYSVSLSSEGDNVYKVEGRDIYLKTAYCYAPTGTEVILVWKSNYGFTKGKIISED